jgi:transposase
MFIRKVTRTVKGRSYTSYLLLEAVRTPKGPRQKLVCSLGDLKPRPRAEWLKLAHKIETALIGQADLLDESDADVARIVAKVRARADAPSPPTPASEAAIAVDLTRVTTEQHREAGPVYVGVKLWQRLGMDTILAGLGLSDATRRLACALVLNRLIAPASEYAMPAWIRRTALADLLGADLDAIDAQPLYRTLDKLHPHRAAIEAALHARERVLFNLAPTIFLYDLTSTYFEGLAAANPKAKRGYSRDHRPDCKQVVVGLVVSREGFPIAHEIFAGNTQDRTTLATMLDRLAVRVGLPEGATVVVDRGMAFAATLAEITARKLHYIVAARQSERDQWLADFDADSGFEPVVRPPSPTNPAQTKSTVEVKLARDGEETHVLCVSEGRSAKDRAIRAKHEGRLLADVAKLRARIEAGKLVDPVKIGEAIGRLKERYPRVARYYAIAYETETKALTVARDAERSARAERLDGSYLLKSDRTDLSAAEAWRIYSLLTRAEAAFRAMKSPLAERPIFHQTERRVEAHIFVCVLAFHLLVAIEHTLRSKGVHTSWASVRDRLGTHQVCTVVLPTSAGAILRIRSASTPEPEHLEIYRLLDLPKEIIAPKRIWSEEAIAA